MLGFVLGLVLGLRLGLELGLGFIPIFQKGVYTLNVLSNRFQKLTEVYLCSFEGVRDRTYKGGGFIETTICYVKSSLSNVLIAIRIL